MPDSLKKNLVKWLVSLGVASFVALPINTYHRQLVHYRLRITFSATTNKIGKSGLACETTSSYIVCIFEGESRAIISLRAVRAGTGECKVLIIDHANVF